VEGTTPRHVTAAELSAAIKLSTSAIYEAVALGKIPHYRLGRSIRFDLAEVLAALRGAA